MLKMFKINSNIAKYIYFDSLIRRLKITDDKIKDKQLFFNILISKLFLKLSLIKKSL